MLISTRRRTCSTLPTAKSVQNRRVCGRRHAAQICWRPGTFVSETVFSHASKLALLEDAQMYGFFVMLLVVCLDQPEFLLERVTEGGHAVPAERILARYPRTLANLAIAVRQADAAILYDSQTVAPGTHAMVAVCKKQATQQLVTPLPQWAQSVLEWQADGSPLPGEAPLLCVPP